MSYKERGNCITVFLALRKRLIVDCGKKLQLYFLDSYNILSHSTVCLPWDFRLLCEPRYSDFHTYLLDFNTIVIICLKVICFSYMCEAVLHWTYISIKNFDYNNKI